MLDACHCDNDTYLTVTMFQILSSLPNNNHSARVAHSAAEILQSHFGDDPPEEKLITVIPLLYQLQDGVLGRAKNVRRFFSVLGQV